MAALYHYMPCQLHTKGKSTLTLVIIWGREVRGSVKRKFLEQTWRTFLQSTGICFAVTIFHFPSIFPCKTPKSEKINSSMTIGSIKKLNVTAPIYSP